MATPQKPKPAGSRWAFISQAVASVESGLDKILAEDEEPSKRSPSKPAIPQENGSTPRVSTDLKRSDSNRTNDRLQARLAQAMASKNASRATSPLPTSQPGTRPETPAEADKTNDTSANSESAPADVGEADTTAADVAGAIKVPSVDITQADGHTPSRISRDSSRQSQDLPSRDPSFSTDHARISTDATRLSSDLPSRISTSDATPDPDAVLLSSQIEHEKSIAVLQDEINGYLERIDALQRNMQMLAKETIQTAKQTKADSTSSPFDKQLAEKDEKIALLIEEGTRLTKGEMQYRAIIKKLRIEAASANKDQESVRQRAEKAEKSASALRTRAEKAESEARRQKEQLNTLSKSVSDVAAMTKENTALQSTLSDVRAQLSKANRRAEEAEAQAQSDKLEAERRKVADLQDDLSSAKIERELAEGKLKREIDDLKQSLTREKDQARQMETEMLAEQAALETKLESLRFRAEEATTGDQGDSSAKLLRQIEGLQSQYAAASQNWQGIESTLLARITALEKERDELTSRETDLRRKLKDTSNKAKHATKELEEVQQTLHSLQDQQADEVAEAQKGVKRTSELENQVAKLHKELEDQKIRGEKEMMRRLDEERTKILASVPPRLDSPAASLHKAQRGSFMDNLMSPLERPSSRRSSTHPLQDHVNQHSRVNAYVSGRPNGAIPETPSFSIVDDQDDFFANAPATPASIGQTHAESVSRAPINDVISASTAGAGPSVQLVERLSTNVRRLESEKAASKDEISRLSSQRDEARQEVVNLMREVEQKRLDADRLAKLEKQHQELESKHQATLELLGEKTEQVDELKADIVDVKQMYRQLADTMGKT